MNQQFLIYGKIIIDSIRLRSGELQRSTLGGGGPQAAFGMRLWHDSVALLTRSGVDIDPAHERMLRQLDLDLSGWARFADLPTPRGMVEYDEHEHMVDHGHVRAGIGQLDRAFASRQVIWPRLSSRILAPADRFAMVLDLWWPARAGGGVLRGR